MVPGEPVESAALKHQPLCLLLLLVAHIFYDSVTQEPSAHLCGLLSLHMAVEGLEAVGEEAVDHAVSTETLVEPLESVKVATGLQVVFKMRDNLGIHDCGWEWCSLVVFGGHVVSDAESSGEASLSWWDGHSGGSIVCCDAVSAGVPAGVVGTGQSQWYWGRRSCGSSTTAVPLSVHLSIEFHLESLPCSACRSPVHLSATS